MGKQDYVKITETIYHFRPCRCYFDAKPVYNQKFFMQKFNYIHNPVSCKWNLVNDYADYGHSSASFYESGIAKSYQVFDFRTL